MKYLRGFLLVLFGVAAAGLFAGADQARADTPEVTIVIQDHKFEPADVKIPANTKVKLIIENRDPTPEEFESHELNREKIIRGGGSAIIFVGPLEPGTYPFFGEFNPETAQGRIIAE